LGDGSASSGLDGRTAGAEQCGRGTSMRVRPVRTVGLVDELAERIE
jgi:hypothetical protein